MEYRRLGATGIAVSALAIGTASMGRWGNPDRAECLSMLRLSIDAGVTLIDTSDDYSRGDAEEVVGEAVEGRRHDVVIATKFSVQGRDGSSRRAIKRAIEESLRRLRTDYVDVYLLHRYDPSTDLALVLDVLDDLVREGKVLVSGASTFPAWTLVDAAGLSPRGNARKGFGCEEPPYSIFVRGAERELFPVARRLGMGVIVWGPLCGGWLTGKYEVGSPPPAESRAANLDALSRRAPRMDQRYDFENPFNRRKLELLVPLRGIAEDAGLSLTQLALGFALSHPAVSAAIMGPRRPDQLSPMLDAAATELTDDVLDAIDRVVPPGGVVNDADLGWDPPWMDRAARRLARSHPPGHA